MSIERILVGDVAAVLVHRPVLGRDQVPERVLLVGGRDARVGRVGRALGRRARMQQLPRARHAVRGVLREQLVQDRRARPAGADDEHRRRRCARRGSRDAARASRCTSSRLTSARTISLRGHDPAEQVEVGLVLERAQEDAHTVRASRRHRSRRARSRRAPRRATTPRRAGRARRASRDGARTR